MSAESQLAVLETQSFRHGDMLDRMDTNLEKLTEITTNITRILAVHDEKLDQNERKHETTLNLVEQRRHEMSSDIKEIHSRITTTTRDLSAEISDVRKCIVEGIDDLKKELKEDQKFHNDRQRSLEDRIAQLEKWRYMLVGGGIVGGLILNKLISAFDIVIK